MVQGSDKAREKLDAMKERHRQAGVKGVVPLMAGDIMVMWGRFQQCFVHKTLRNQKVRQDYPTVESMLKNYPAVNELIKPSLQQFCKHVRETPEHQQQRELRWCITLRQIVNHILEPRCPCVPGLVVSRGVEEPSRMPGVEEPSTTPSTTTPTTTRSIGYDSCCGSRQKWLPYSDVWPTSDDDSDDDTSDEETSVLHDPEPLDGGAREPGIHWGSHD